MSGGKSVVAKFVFRLKRAFQYWSRDKCSCRRLKTIIKLRWMLYPVSPLNILDILSTCLMFSTCLTLQSFQQPRRTYSSFQAYLRSRECWCPETLSLPDNTVVVRSCFRSPTLPSLSDVTLIDRDTLVVRILRSPKYPH